MLFLRPMHKAVWAQIRGKPILSEDAMFEGEKGVDEKNVAVERVEKL
jgi:hypothetical protein